MGEYEKGREQILDSMRSDFEAELVKAKTLSRDVTNQNQCLVEDVIKKMDQIHYQEQLLQQ